jgi:hypothetical protein
MSSDTIVNCFCGFYFLMTVIVFFFGLKEIKECYRKLNEHLDQKEKEKNAKEGHTHP